MEIPPQGPASIVGKMSLVSPPPIPVALAVQGKSKPPRWPNQSDQISVKSKASRMNYPSNNDLMNFWSPPDETMSMVSY